MMDCTSTLNTAGPGANWTTIFATYIDVAAPNPGTGGYGGGPIWGTWPTSSTVSYVTAGRWHNTLFAPQYACGADPILPANQTITSSRWCVITTQKIGPLVQYRIRVSTSVPGWTGATATVANAFTATAFSWGGSIAPSIGNIQSGNGYPKICDFEFYAGVLNESELAAQEALIGSTAGLPL
jgi:hypothetical protein